MYRKLHGQIFLRTKARCFLILKRFWLKLVSAIFYQIFIFSPNDSPLKTDKCFLFCLKSSFCSQDIYSNFCGFLPSFAHFPDSKGQMEVE